MPGLIQQVKKTVREHGMLSGGETVLCAVSGGADSVALLHVLLELRDELGLTVAAAHMDHGLRGEESRRDLEFTRALARRLGVRFVSKRLGKGALKAAGGSAQEAARKARYAFLEEAASRVRADRVALGHTLDDQAETVLMRLMKGSSLSGLTGIPPVRGQFIRPLIASSRRDIEEFLSSRSIPFVVDSTNLETKYLRNSVRLELIPFIEKRYNPSFKETLARTAVVLSDDDDYIERAAAKAAASALVGRTEEKAVLDRKRLLRLHDAISARVFLSAAQSLGVDSDLGVSHVSSFLSVVRGRRPNASICLPGGIRLVREYDTVVVSKEAEAQGFAEARIEVPGVLRLEGVGRIEASVVRPPRRFKTGPETAWFDHDAVASAGGLIARRVRAGDRMTPFGMTGSKKLKDMFIDAKVSASERKRTPVVTAGGIIVWVAGLRQSSDFSVTGATRRALRLTFVKGPA